MTFEILIIPRSIRGATHCLPEELITLSLAPKLLSYLTLPQEVYYSRSGYFSYRTYCQDPIDSRHLSRLAYDIRFLFCSHSSAVILRLVQVLNFNFWQLPSLQVTNQAPSLDCPVTMSSTEITTCESSCNKPAFPLPPELRIKVYEQLLIQPKHSLKPNDILPRARSGEHHYIFTNILRTCRTFYEEALPILYGKNTLHVHDRKFSEPVLPFRKDTLP